MASDAPTETGSTSPASSRCDRVADLAAALRLTYVTLGWMVVEGAASLILGWTSKSLLLEAFGLDSVLELLSASVLLWRLRVEVGGHADEAQIERTERRAARWLGFMLYGLAVFVLCNSAYGLFVARVTDTHESVWGILIGLVAKIGMPVLAGYKLRVAARLNSRALRADAMESITCGYLSIVLMVGLAATWLFGWWWLDSVAALVLIPFLVREGRAAIRGDDCCCGDDRWQVNAALFPVSTDDARRASGIDGSDGDYNLAVGLASTGQVAALLETPERSSTGKEE